MGWVEDLRVKPIFDGFHEGPLEGMDTCARAPLLVTCSASDRTVRVWNYRTRRQLICHCHPGDVTFQPTNVSIHPNGELVLVGLKGRVVLYHVLQAEGVLMELEEFTSIGAKAAEFSPGGDRFALIGLMEVRIFDTYDRRLACVIPDHTGAVTAWGWEADGASFTTAGK